MKKLLFLLVFIPLVSFGQNNFNIDEPEGWFISHSDNYLKENIKRILTDTRTKGNVLNQLDELESKTLYISHKYNLANYGLISPTINVGFAKNKYWSNIEEVKKNQDENFPRAISKVVDNFKIIKSEYITIDGNKGHLMKSTYNIRDILDKRTIRSTMYVFIISDELNVQIAFSDFEDDDCQDVLDKVLQSIKF